jgi:hypothetical protein
MGRRTTKQLLGHDRDELVRGGGTAVADRPAGGNVRDRVLQLQREYGNTAVAGLVVQRKGGGKKPAPKVENYTPEWDTTITSTAGELRQSAAPQLSAKEEWQIRKGIHWYEQAYLREKSENVRKMDALTIARAYEKVGDGARKAWWMKVHTGEIDPFAGEKRHA